MSSVLISIKPAHCKEIYLGNKKVELRRKIGKRFNEGTKIYIYTSSPVKQITGEAVILKIIKETTCEVKSLVTDDACVSSSYFDQYFANCEYAYAVYIMNVIEYTDDKKIPLKTMRELGLTPPQSFCYTKVFD